ncbi:MAG: hypothetical protein ACLTRS_02115 [Lachnospiraceae bacterium]
MELLNSGPRKRPHPRKMCTNDTFNVFYRAKSDGSLYCSEWYQDNDGSWYYC